MKRASYIVTPAYLLACLLLGGASNGGFVANAMLQLAGLLLITAAFWRSSQTKLGPNAWGLKWFAWFAIGLIAVQFLPVPSIVWEWSHGRRELLQEAETIGLDYFPKFVSLSPYEALESALWLLPAMALGVFLFRRSEWRAEHLAWAIQAATVLSVIAGTVQVTQGNGSPAYLYAITNRGSTVGFFANSNHLATLLLISIPFAAALAKTHLERGEAFMVVTAMGLLLLAIVGLVVNGSDAGKGLMLPVVLCSAMIFTVNKRIRLSAFAIVVVGLLAGASWIAISDEGRALFDLSKNEFNTGSREAIWLTTWRAVVDFLPFGSGLGTFTEIYPRFEDSADVTSEYINHAHNDYLELILEFGVLILPVLAGFLVWWGASFYSVWGSDNTPTFAYAGAIASAIILLHSIVDYPLRTAAISAVFIVSLCLMTTKLQGGNGRPSS